MRRSSLPIVCLLFATFANLLPCQCSTTWQPGGYPGGINGDGRSLLLWDPDGAGPAGEALLLGGDFDVVGAERAYGLATYDVTSGDWHRFGELRRAASTPRVHATAVGSNGDLFVAGGFTEIDGVPVTGLARFDGTNWHAMGVGPTAWISSMAVLPNGDLVVGGWFASWMGASGLPAGEYVARWDGTQWSAMGAGFQYICDELVVLPNGDLIACGALQSSGPVTLNGVARWDGSSWQPLGQGTSNGTQVMAVMPNGDLIVGGNFGQAGGSLAAKIARWDGAQWHPLGSGSSAEVTALLALPNGHLIAAGDFRAAPGVAHVGLAQWDGTQWLDIALDFDDDVYDLSLLPNGDVVATGRFTTIGPTIVSGIAKYDGTSWMPMATGQPGFRGRYDATTTATGEVVSCSHIPAAPGSLFGYGGVSKWSGTEWETLGFTLANSPRCVAGAPNGDIIVGGSFSGLNGVASTNVIRHDGQSWQPLAQGVFYLVNDVAVTDAGDIFAGGLINSPYGPLERWDGLGWSRTGTGWDGAVHALEPLPGGQVLVGGAFTTVAGIAANHVAITDGGNWAPMGSGFDDTVTQFVVLANGNVLAMGEFTMAGSTLVNHIAEWDGSTWLPLGSPAMPGCNGPIADAQELPNGDLLIAGEFTMAGGVPAENVARFDGATWSAVDAGVDGPVHALVEMPTGEVMAVGSFFQAGGEASNLTAYLASDCPASAVPVATSCIGPSGAVTLAADTLPWIGSTCSTTASGLAPNSVAIANFGIQAIHVPLALVHPTGLPNCSLLATGEISIPSAPVAGETSVSFAVPNATAVIGFVLHEQFVQIELGPAGLASLSSSNALTLTIGSF